MGARWIRCDGRLATVEIVTLGATLQMADLLFCCIRILEHDRQHWQTENSIFFLKDR